MIQDIAPKHLYNEWKKNAVPKKSSAVVQFRGQDLLCRIDANGLKFPSRAQFTEPDEAFTYLFELDGREYYLLFDENERALDGYSYRNIGLFRTEKPKELAYAAVSAWHLCSWYRDARYCGRCGEKLVHDGNERMMRCPKCGNMIFPRINPSVIVAVTHGDYLLLTKYAYRPGAQRTARVAGVTEFAESFEQTVHREVMEEVGLKVKDLRYYRCQPWGISGNIMMGYWCRLDGDDDTIHLDNFELADGAWVRRKDLQEPFVNNGIALTAADTGHLVLATLHTQDAVGTVNRILDVLPDRQHVCTQLADCLLGICCQRLLPRCDRAGRAAAFEVLVATPALRNLIREGRTHQLQSYLQTGARYGMQTMEDAVKALQLRGIIA